MGEEFCGKQGVSLESLTSYGQNVIYIWAIQESDVMGVDTEDGKLHHFKTQNYCTDKARKGFFPLACYWHS